MKRFFSAALRALCASLSVICIRAIQDRASNAVLSDFRLPVLFRTRRNGTLMDGVGHLLESFLRRHAHALEQRRDPLRLTDDGGQIALEIRIRIAALEQIAVANDGL